MKKITIPVYVYDTVVYVYIGTRKQCDKRVRKLEKKMGVDLGGELGACASTYKLIVNKQGVREINVVCKKSCLTHGTLSHEMLHVVSYLMTYVDIPMGYDSEEAWAFLMTRLVQSVYRELGYKELL